MDASTMCDVRRSMKSSTRSLPFGPFASSACSSTHTYAARAADATRHHMTHWLDTRRGLE
eukprot:7793004-Prorocentrum_lima.AAC.1